MINARFCVCEELRAYKEEYTVRGSEMKKSNLVLRQNLDSIGSEKRGGGGSGVKRERKEE